MIIKTSKLRRSRLHIVICINDMTGCSKLKKNIMDLNFEPESVTFCDYKTTQ